MQNKFNRRANDRRLGKREAAERRSQERRMRDSTHQRLRFPSFAEQRIQFITRYVFLALGLSFTNLVSFSFSPYISPEIINWVGVVYFIFISLAFYHAWRWPANLTRYRITMWVDIFLVTLGVVNDPYDIPPALVVFIMIALGNGMRYGMRMFGEALVGCFIAAVLALSVRFAFTAHTVSIGLGFLTLFGSIILLYSYILMARIENARNNLERSSRQDALTALLNRMGLQETANFLFKDMDAYGGIATVMFVDLDQFKSVNDTHGHAVGDETLCHFVDILRRNIRAVDIAARYGGDEFIVLMPETTIKHGEQAARRVQADFAAWAAEAGLPCNASIGLSEAPRDGRNLDQLLVAADAALYHVKSIQSGGVMSVDQLPADYHHRPAPA